VVALRRAASRSLAIRALVPLTVLMVIYTGLSLSILAEPLVRFRTPDPGYTQPWPPAAPVLISQSAGRSGYRPGA
jgi:hypothetical protein